MSSAASAEPNATANTKESLYEASTQHKHWRYSPQSLQRARQRLNEDASQAIRRTFELEDPGSSRSIQFLTPEEENLLVKLYISKVGQLCAHFRMPEIVEATASTYLRRFYLHNTVMDWHPKSVMLTAIFLAAKTTNNPISIDTYASHIPKTTKADVLDLEFLVAQSLGFEFVVWHAYRALWGMYLDIQSLPSLAHEFSAIHQAYITAIHHVRIARLTDAELFFTPSQIALACWHIAAPELAESWAKAKFEEDVLKPESGILDGIKQLIERDGSVPDVETVREIDKRLRICKNPEKVEGTKAYNRKKAEEEAKAKEKRDRKAAEERLLEAANDPFGAAIDPQQVSLAQRAKQLDDDDY